MVTEHRYGNFSTDPDRWNLEVCEGRQWWSYGDGNVPQSTVSRYWLGKTLHESIDDSRKAPKNALEAAWRGYEFFEQLQTADGHWAGEYGGPLFLMPGLVIVWYLTGFTLSEPQKLEMIRYLRNRQNDDGGWGLHIEGPSTVLGTATNYCVIRLLGVEAEDSTCRSAREWLHAHGGALGAPSWGKFWLAVLNVYDWEGFQPVLPELWLIPSWAPVNIGRTWCHSRQIYLPMSYCYAKRIRAPEDDLIRALRKELYIQPYEEIDWKQARTTIAPVDIYAPHHKLLDVANAFFNVYEKIHWPSLREYALGVVLDHIRAEDLNSKYVGIGPISKMINMLCMWHAEGPKSRSFQEHVLRVPDYLWMASDGMRMQGTNGSQLWDTALAVHALMDAKIPSQPQFQASVVKVLEFLEDCQIKQNTPDHEKYYRHISKGAFPFSTRDCGWIVSDCTAEGLKAVIVLQQLANMPKLIPDHRIFDGINVLLSMQNSDGGFASYEPQRGSAWLEVMNPSEVFGEIMVDYSYVECSSAVVQALSTFRKVYPDHRKEDVQACIADAIRFIRGRQRSDGSWFGSWGVCFTYAIWFGIEALACVGDFYRNSSAVKKACDFLIAKQRDDGGWGESYEACTKKAYVQHPVESQVVNTAWACLALLAAQYPNEEVIRRGILLIMKRQRLSGEWKQEAIEGVFNKTCMISYPNYKFIFTIWALGRYAKVYDNPTFE